MSLPISLSEVVLINFILVGQPNIHLHCLSKLWTLVEAADIQQLMSTIHWTSLGPTTEIKFQHRWVTNVQRTHSKQAIKIFGWAFLTVIWTTFPQPRLLSPLNYLRTQSRILSSLICFPLQHETPDSYQSRQYEVPSCGKGHWTDHTVGKHDISQQQMMKTRLQAIARLAMPVQWCLTTRSQAQVLEPRANNKRTSVSSGLTFCRDRLLSAYRQPVSNEASHHRR